MAIQIGGTTVVNDSRQLQNISGVDATTKGNLPYVQDVVSTTTTYTPSLTNQTIDDKISLSTSTVACHSVSKTTSTSTTKVVLDTTMPTFSNQDVLKITSDATTSNGVTTGGYLGGYYRVWLEVSGNNIFSILSRGSFAASATTVTDAMNLEQNLSIRIDSTVSVSTYGTCPPALPLISGGKLLIEFYNYPQSSVSGNGYYTYNDIDFSINVLSNVSQTFFDLGIL